MTVGIAAACEGSGEAHVVVAADRMITSGMVTRIEYEHTRSKLNVIVDDPDASVEGVYCVALAAGTVAYSDAFFTKLNQKLDEIEPAGINHIAELGSQVIQEITRERGNKQVLNQFGITLEEIRDGSVNMSDEIITQLLSEVSEEQTRILEHLEVIFAGVDHTGANIYSIPDGNVAPHNTIGYHAIGSGAQPARSSFIRERYDPECDIEDSLLTVVESKIQSEEAQGVGARMDVSAISQSQGCYKLSDETDIEDGELSELGELKKIYEEVKEAERDARAEALSSSDYEFSYNDED